MKYVTFIMVFLGSVSQLKKKLPQEVTHRILELEPIFQNLCLISEFSMVFSMY